MYPLISVYGIAATDLSGNICFEKKVKSASTEFNPMEKGIVTKTVTVSQHDRIPSSTKSVDRGLLREFIQNMKDAGSIFVVGEETSKDMGKLLDGVAHGVVSNKEGASYVADGIVQKGRSIKYDDGDTLSDFVLATALRVNRFNVCVLGGKSVYESFAGLYTSFTHVRFSLTIDEESGTKRLTVDDEDSSMMIPPRNRNKDIIYSSPNMDIIHYTLGE